MVEEQWDVNIEMYNLWSWVDISKQDCMPVFLCLQMVIFLYIYLYFIYSFLQRHVNKKTYDACADFRRKPNTPTKTVIRGQVTLNVKSHK